MHLILCQIRVCELLIFVGASEGEICQNPFTRVIFASVALRNSYKTQRIMATEQEIEKMELELMDLKKKIAEGRRSLPQQPVDDYTLRGAFGEETKLSTLFGTKNELILIHNMGKKCTYCTLWADGLNGFVKHLENRSALVLSGNCLP